MNHAVDLFSLVLGELVVVVNFRTLPGLVRLESAVLVLLSGMCRSYLLNFARWVGFAELAILCQWLSRFDDLRCFAFGLHHPAPRILSKWGTDLAYHFSVDLVDEFFGILLGKWVRWKDLVSILVLFLQLFFLQTSPILFIEQIAHHWRPYHCK